MRTRRENADQINRSILVGQSALVGAIERIKKIKTTTEREKKLVTSDAFPNGLHALLRFRSAALYLYCVSGAFGHGRRVAHSYSYSTCEKHHRLRARKDFSRCRNDDRGPTSLRLPVHRSSTVHVNAGASISLIYFTSKRSKRHTPSRSQ